jgi:hypothetical protein
MILLRLYHFLSFPSFSKLHRVVLVLQTCSTYMFVYSVCFCVCVHLLDLSSIYERKHVAFVLSEHGLHHLTWCHSIASIYLHTTWCHSFLLLNKHTLSYCTVLFWTVLCWSLSCKCLYCILTYISLDICPRVVSLDHMAILFLAFWRISLLLSIMVVKICIPTNNV